MKGARGRKGTTKYDLSKKSQGLRSSSVDKSERDVINKIKQEGCSVKLGKRWGKIAEGKRERRERKAGGP